MAIETQIRILSDSLAADRAKAEGEFDRLKERIERTELRVNLVFDGKKAQADFDKILDDLQRRADARPVVVPVQLQDAGGGMPAGMPGLPGGAGGAAAGGAGLGMGLRGGLGRGLGAFAIARAAADVLKAANDAADYRAAGQRGDIDAQVKAQESIRGAVGQIPFAGQLGVQLNRTFFTGKEQDQIDQIKKETEEQDKITKIMERRNELMRKSIEHAKDLTRQAEREREERDRPGSGAIARARDALTAFNVSLGGRAPVGEEQAAQGALQRNIDSAQLALSNKEIKEGQDALAKWRTEMERWNKEAERAARAEAARVGRLEDARAGAESLKLRAAGRGDEADRNELARTFDKRIRAEEDAEVKHALQLQKNAAMEALNEKQRIEAAKAVADNWERAADAADAAARAILQSQAFAARGQEASLRGRGLSGAAEFVRVRQQVRDVFAAAGDDPEKLKAAREIGLDMLNEFTKGQGGRGGMFGGGLDFARHAQQAILQGDGPERKMAVDFATQFAESLKRGDNPLGKAAKDISDAAKALQDAAGKFQPLGVITP